MSGLVLQRPTNPKSLRLGDSSICLIL